MKLRELKDNMKFLNSQDESKMINKARKYVDDVRGLALKHGIDIGMILSGPCGNSDERYNYIGKEIYLKQTGEVIPMPDSHYELALHSGITHRIIHPLNKINHYDEIVSCGKDKTVTELLSLIGLLSDALENDEKIKLSATVKGISRDTSIKKDVAALIYEYAHRCLHEAANAKFGKLYSDLFINDTSYEYITVKRIYKKIDDKRELDGEDISYRSTNVEIDQIIDEKQLSKIKEYELKMQKLEVPNQIEFMKGEIQYCVKHLKERGVFCKKSKTIKTNEACFIYDILLLIGAIKAGEFENNQDKYVFIKNKIMGKDCVAYHHAYTGKWRNNLMFT